MPDPIVPAPALPQGLGAVLPAHARRGTYVPVVGGFLNVTLPGELVRTEVEKMMTRDIALVRVKSIVMNKHGHDVRTNALIAVQRSFDELHEIWVPISETETREREQRELAERAAARVALAAGKHVLIGTQETSRLLTASEQGNLDQGLENSYQQTLNAMVESQVNPTPKKRARRAKGAAA